MHRVFESLEYDTKDNWQVPITKMAKKAKKSRPNSRKLAAERKSTMVMQAKYLELVVLFFC
jgi:hypothetical protein